MTEADGDILQRIQSLVAEEHRLREGDDQAGDRAGDRPGDQPAGPDRERLRELEEQLDQCWDLLRQRRARREFGEDPGEASVRSTSTVEHYQQ